MKKRIVILMLLLSACSLYSIEVIIMNVIEINGPRNDEYSKIYYINDVLFYAGIKPYKYVKDGQLFQIISSEKKILDGYGEITNIYKSENGKSLIYYNYNWTENSFISGYEVFAQPSGVVYYEDRTFDEIEKLGKEQNPSVYPFEYRTVFGEKLIFRSEVDNKNSNKIFSFKLFNKNNCIIYDFYNDYYDNELMTYEINDKVNRIATIYSAADGSKSEIVIFSLIYAGTINDTRVRLRTEPNLTSVTLDYLDAGEKVKVIDRSEKKQEIDDMEAYWLQVETKDKQTGWVYGWFVDVE